MNASAVLFSAAAVFWTRIARTRSRARTGKIVFTNDWELKVERIVAPRSPDTSGVQIILDFDRCITSYYGPQGGRGVSCHGVLERFRSVEVREAAQRLNDHYYPIEVDAKLSRAEKIPLMIEWYTKVNELFLQSGLYRRDLVTAVDGANLQLRPGMKEILQFAGANPSLPCTIFSAGIADVIAVVLERHVFPEGIPPNVHIVSNRMMFQGDLPTDRPGTGSGTGPLIGWNDDGRAPLVHMFNKNFATHPEFATLAATHRRVILAGDGLGDAHMADGIPEPNIVLRVGFLNHDVETLLPQYEAAFDAVVLHDGPADLILDTVHKAHAL